MLPEELVVYSCNALFNNNIIELNVLVSPYTKNAIYPHRQSVGPELPGT